MLLLLAAALSTAFLGLAHIQNCVGVGDKTLIGRVCAEIDAIIKPELENFSFHRLTPVDRNILRLATYEMRFSDHIPPAAALNEAIEIAKRFGTEESPGFVNGILDTILKKSES